MKKQINLYQANCYPERPKWTFLQFSVATCICLLALLLSYFVMRYQSDSLNTQLRAHQSEVSSQQQQLSQLVVELRKKRIPESQQREYERLQDEIDGKKRLLNSISDIDIQESLHFSALMRGLSATNMPDLSISYFSMVAGTLSINGSAKDSDSLPLWLANMQHNETFSNIAFKGLSIEKADGFFTFQLSNSAIKGGADE